MRPAEHYCIPPLGRLDRDRILELVRRKKYFILHAPRQTGKTARCYGSGAEGGGFEGGRSIPSPEPSVDTLGMLGYAQVGLPALVL